MAYTMTKNEQFNSLEISFGEKPAEEIREALKALRFRWHSVKKCWYGYAEADAIRQLLDGAKEAQPAPAVKAAPKAAPANKYGVKVGDIFRATWGYEQTNNDFFQVVELVGTGSVRVREVYLPLIESTATGPMAEDRKLKVVREILPAADHSVFIKDQERGDVKRLKSWAKDGVSNPQFKLSDFCDAYHVSGDEIKVYESWYA